MKTALRILSLVLLSLLPLKGFSQSVTPVASNQVNVTDGAGGYTLQPYGGGSSATNGVRFAVETYGAVGDATGAVGVGTDNTTSMQACINAIEALTIPQGSCVLANKLYRITAPIIINKSSVNIVGTSEGAWSTTTSNQLLLKAPISGIVIDSATATAVQLNPASAGGGLASPVSFNQFKDFSIIRTVADTGASTGSCKGGAGTGVGAAGLSIEYAGGWVVDDVWSFDSACLFYYNNAGAYGTGRMENSGGMWASNGFNPTHPVYGILVNGAFSAESFRLRHSFIQTLYPGFSGVQSVGLLVTGAQLNDFMIDNFETSFVTYGEYFQYLGGGGNFSCSDIHLNNIINDSFFQDGIVLSGMTQACGSSVEINGGWAGTGQAGAASDSAGILISGSSGVTISNTEFGQNGSQKYGVLANSSSSHISILGNHFLNQGVASIALNAVANASITGNVIEAPTGNTQSMIQGVSLTRSVISGNTLSGFANFGITLDAGSSNNTVSGVPAIDPTNIGTQVSNTGTNNTFDGIGGLIAKITGAGTPASLSFTVPQNYQNLKLVGNFLITAGANLTMRFNSDSTAAHYAYGLLYQNNGTTCGASCPQSNSATQALIAASGGMVSLEIPNYKAGTANGVNFAGTWSTMTIGSNSLSGSAGGLWNGTDVTSLSLQDSGGTALFTTASTFSLYGLN